VRTKKKAVEVTDNRTDAGKVVKVQDRWNAAGQPLGKTASWTSRCWSPRKKVEDSGKLAGMAGKCRKIAGMRLDPGKNAWVLR